MTFKLHHANKHAGNKVDSFRRLADLFLRQAELSGWNDETLEHVARAMDLVCAFPEDMIPAVAGLRHFAADICYIGMVYGVKEENPQLTMTAERMPPRVWEFCVAWLEEFSAFDESYFIEAGPDWPSGRGLPDRTNRPALDVDTEARR